MLRSRKTLIPIVLLVAGLTTAITGCNTTQSGPGGADGGDTSSTDSGDSPASSGDVKGAVLPGTGKYEIGTEAPYGGYRLSGEPEGQPAGCTYSIQDADGEPTFENLGSYVFLTDIKEAVTFVTDGCPDWVQFE